MQMTWPDRQTDRRMKRWWYCFASFIDNKAINHDEWAECGWQKLQKRGEVGDHWSAITVFVDMDAMYYLSKSID